MTAKHTPGPWLRIGAFVYALMHAGWRRGEEQFKNRINIQISADRDCPIEELEAVVALVQAAPDLLEALQALLSAEFDPAGCTSEIVNDKQAFKEFLAQCEAKTKSAEDKARAAIAKATGESA